MEKETLTEEEAFLLEEYRSQVEYFFNNPQEVRHMYDPDVDAWLEARALYNALFCFDFSE